MGTVNQASKIVFGYSGNANITTFATHSRYITTDLDTGGHDVTFSGAITGTGLLNKIGAGTLTLTGTSNTYSGGTSITEGSLRIATDNALGSGGGTKTINGGALQLAGGGVFNSAWALTDAATNAIEVIEGEEATYAGTLSNAGGNPGGFDKTGAGTLKLTGTSQAYTGATTIREGTLSLAADNNIGSGNAVIDGGKLLLTSTTGYTRTWILGDSEDNAIEAGQTSGVTFGGVLTGSGGFTKTGANGLTLDATNTFTGLVTVGEGTLVNTGSLASKRLRLLAGTTFRNSGTHSLDGGSLAVAGPNATYAGNLSARDAALTFEFDAAPSQPLLTVTGNADVSRSVVRLSAPREVLMAAQDGQTYALMRTDGTLTTDGAVLEAEVSDLTTVYHLGLIRPSAGTLSAVLEGTEAAPTAKAFSEGYISSIALITETADLVSDAGIRNAAMAAREPGPSAFGGLSGGWTRYETGSHVDSDSFSVLAGVALGSEIGPGRLTLGLFLEYGFGSYDTFNSFPGAPSAEGEGDASHAGGGLLARLDFNDGGSGHFYLEGSGRIGSTRNSYTFEGISGYKVNSRYFGFHAGVGRVFTLGGGASLDAYAKYFWTTQEGKDVTLTTGEPIKFDDVNSSRVRVGGRFSKALTDNVAPYVGLAWEHEFDGDMTARNARNNPIDRPTLKGDTGIGELGLSITPSPTGPLSIELGIQGLAGRRRGVSGSAQLKLTF